MSEKRKISTRKIVQTILTIVLLCACVFVVLSASKWQGEKRVMGVHIEIENEDYCQFVSKEEIQKILFEKRHIKPSSLVIGKVDLKKMEAILATNPWIETAQIFIDNKKTLHVNVTQRVPRLRVFDRIGNTYYLDSNKHELPISDQYTHYEVLFVNVPQIKNDSLGDLLKSRMLSISKFIKQDTFWLAQTAEVVVNSHNDFQIIPVLGKHKILLGDANDLKHKLENVFAFYQNVLKKIGWDKYEIVDARFKDQIVSSPSLPWNAPVDRALTNMNWVKTIVGDLTKEKELSSINSPKDTTITSR